MAIEDKMRRGAEITEWNRQYFVSRSEIGRTLPDPRAVSDGTTFYLKESDGVKVEHVMVEGKWHKKVIDGNDQVTLEEV